MIAGVSDASKPSPSTDASPAIHALCLREPPSRAITSAAANGGTVPFTSIYRAITQADAGLGYTANANRITAIAAVTYDNLSDLASRVEGSGFGAAGNVFVAHPLFKGAIRKLKDSQGNPIFEPSPREGSPDTLFGYPILWSQGAVVQADVYLRGSVLHGCKRTGRRHGEFVGAAHRERYALELRHCGAQVADKFAELVWEHGAGRIAERHHGSSGLDRRLHGSGQKIQIAARGVQGRVLNVGAE